MSAYKTQLDRIGNTPFLPLFRLGEAWGGGARLFGKCEGANPFGSAKDRAALYMIRDAAARGLLPPGGHVIEPTSGNTGIALAAIGRLLGYRVTVVMPDNMSRERCAMIAAYGASLVLTPAARGMAGAIARAEELAAADGAAFIPGQFENPANARAHEETTGPEMLRDFRALCADGIASGEIDLFVAGVGTGGSITGIGRALKREMPAVSVVAVEPLGSPVLSGGERGAHGLAGIGAGFIPSLLDRTLLDEILTVGEGEAYAAAREVATCEGLLVGISGGAALAAAGRLAARPENRGKNIAVLLPDGGEKYLSTDLYLVK